MHTRERGVTSMRLHAGRNYVCAQSCYCLLSERYTAGKISLSRHDLFMSLYWSEAQRVWCRALPRTPLPMQALGAAGGGGASATPPSPLPPQALAWTPMRTYSSLNPSGRGPVAGGSVGAKRVRMSEPDADALGAGARRGCMCGVLREVCMCMTGMRLERSAAGRHACGSTASEERASCSGPLCQLDTGVLCESSCGSRAQQALRWTGVPSGVAAAWPGTPFWV